MICCPHSLDDSVSVDDHLLSCPVLTLYIILSLLTIICCPHSLYDSVSVDDYLLPSLLMISLC